MKVPDVIGFTLEKGIEMLKKNSLCVNSISVTSPPKQRSDEYDKNCRIIRLKVLENGSVDLLVIKPL